MRFIAQYTNYILNIHPGRKRVTEFGVEVLEEPIAAEFDSRAWNYRDYESAIAAFRFRGTFQHEDEATPVSPAYRLAVYDTDEQALVHSWDEETKAMVETRLLAAPALGRDYVLVTEEALQPPWPAYDSFEGDAEALATQVMDLGYSLEDVVVYESSKWGQQRGDVLEALQAAIDARDTGEIIVT